VTYSLGTTVAQLEPRDASVPSPWRSATSSSNGVRDLPPLSAGRRQSGSITCRWSSSLAARWSTTSTTLGCARRAATPWPSWAFDFSAIEDSEPDAASGNGGLGRLAACFLDSLATLGMRASDYGITTNTACSSRRSATTSKIEKPDNWRTYGNARWEIQKPQHVVLVPLYGRIEHSIDRAPATTTRCGWIGRSSSGAARHARRRLRRPHVNFLRVVLRPGLAGIRRGHLQRGRLRPRRAAAGDVGNHLQGTLPVRQQLRRPGAAPGQEYFLVACAVRYAPHYLANHEGVDQLPDKVAFQLNDTHPALTVVELMRSSSTSTTCPGRKLGDHRRPLCYTNHTLLPERWSAGRCRCSSTCCRGTCKSSTRSIAAS